MNTCPLYAAGGPAQPVSSRWGAFSSVAFTVIWTASVLSNVGTAMFDTASGWLITSLDANPMTVSLVQVAVSFPLFLFTLPAGALADVIELAAVADCSRTRDSGGLRDFCRPGVAGPRDAGAPAGDDLPARRGRSADLARLGSDDAAPCTQGGPRQRDGLERRRLQCRARRRASARRPGHRGGRHRRPVLELCGQQRRDRCSIALVAEAAESRREPAQSQQISSSATRSLARLSSSVRQRSCRLSYFAHSARI